MKYSQNDEQDVILNFFGNTIGNVLSLGENDGLTLSNSRALIEKNWYADLVEPSPTAYRKLYSLYKTNELVKTHNIAIGDKDGMADFYDSGTLLKTGDVALVSTLERNELIRWKGTVQFDKIQVQVKTLETFFYDCGYLSTTPYELKKGWDFISIDCEGLDFSILSQMVKYDFCGARLLCVEFNGKGEYLYTGLMKGWKLIHKNAENLIYSR